MYYLLYKIRNGAETLSLPGLQKVDVIQKAELYANYLSPLTSCLRLSDLMETINYKTDPKKSPKNDQLSFEVKKMNDIDISNERYNS